MNQPDSNPLRKELARSQQEGLHPDSDVLTAFAEGSLLARERESILEHLAICTRCREELSIATDASPELEAEVRPLPLSLPTRPPIRSWLPWAAAAAGVLIVSSALILHQQWKPAGEARSDGNASIATKEMAQAPVQQSQLPPPSEPKTTNAPQPHKAHGSVARREPMPPQEESSTAAPNASAPLQRQSAQPIPSQAELGNSNDHSGSDSRALAKKRADASRAEGYSAALKQDQANSNQMTRAKAFSATSQAVGGQGAVVAGANAGFADTSSVPMMRKATGAGADRPHWRINDLGQLERSFGDGDWQPVPTRETSKLRVVSVSGSEVWVGGENLRLEHSSDNGNTWQSIKLPPKNGTSQAVTHIRFPTPQEGVIDSDDGTSWNTTDGGRTWK